MQLAGVTDHPVIDHHLGTAAGMPRQFPGWTQTHLHPAGAGDHPDRLEGVSGLHRTARTPRPARLAQSGQHRTDVHRLLRQGLVEGSDLVLGRPAVGGDQTDGTRLRGRLHHLGDGEQRDVTETAGHVAGQSLKQSRQQRGGEVRTIRLERVEHRGGDPPRIGGVQPPLVEHPGRQERSRQHLHQTRQRQRLTDGTAALLRGRQTTPGRSIGQHRRDDVQALQSQHLLDQVGGRLDVRAPTGRRDDQVRRVGVRLHPGADLREPADRSAIGVGNPGHPIGKVDRHPDRRR